MEPSEPQKNIAFILNSVPSEAVTPSPVSADVLPAVPQTQADSSPQQGASNPPPAVRPHPVPRKMAGSRHVISARELLTAIKPRFLGSTQKPLDARQKKTAVLGFVLVVVFVAVLLFAFGSGPSRAKAASKKPDSANAQLPDVRQLREVENWKQPEVYPESLRDPTKAVSNLSAGNTQPGGDLAVRGIVYSKTKPSAIVADQIVFEGDVLAGAKITKIEKDFVEFEKNGKRWRQQVGP